MKVPVQKLSFLIFGLNQKGRWHIKFVYRKWNPSVRFL
jgi:hypothetical protein